MSVYPKIIYPALCLLALVPVSCSRVQRPAPKPSGAALYPHAPSWAKTRLHGESFSRNRQSCAACHGSDLKGGESQVACLKCHNYPHDRKWALPENHGAAFMKLVEIRKASGAPGGPRPGGFGECMNCHMGRGATAFGHSTTATACASCHADMPHDRKFKAPDTGALIPHGDYVASHAGKKGSCLTCHANPERRSPQLDTCISCHKEKPPFNFGPMPVKGQVGGPEAPAGADESADGLPLDWKTVNARVLEPACVQCHSASDPRGQINVDNYEAAVKDLAAIGKSVEPGGTMPRKGEFSSAQRYLLLDWIAAGAPKESELKFAIKGRAAGGEKDSAPEILPAGASAQEEIMIRGRYLFRASACGECHTSNHAVGNESPQLELGGGREFKTDAGVFYAPNISPSKVAGIGGWTFKDFLRSMRDGVSPGWRYYYPVYPYPNYSKMSDADIYAVWSYMMSLPAVDHLRNKEHKLPFPFAIGDFNVREAVFAWRAFNFENQFLAPVQRKGPLMPDTTKSDLWNRGAYLVEGPLHCTMCHTPRNLMNGYVFSMWFGGSEQAGGEHPGPNLTPDPTTGLKGWTAEDWVKFLAHGKTRPGGEMEKFIKDVTSPLTKYDKRAVAEYMMSLRPVKNQKLYDKINGSRH